MTNEQILEQQVEALEKLIQLKQAIIDEQDAKIQKLQGQQVTIGNVAPYIPYVTTPQLPWASCPDGQAHQWPQNWMGVMPPCCTRCGASAAQQVQGGWVTVSSSDTLSIDGISQTKVHTTGYVQPVDPTDPNNNVYTITSAAQNK